MISFFKSNDKDGRQGSKAQLWILLIGAALGVALLLFGNMEKQESAQPSPSDFPRDDEMVLYQDYLEARVKSICEAVSGVGDVTAIVTLSGSFEDVYATEKKESGEEYVILGSGANATALFLSREAPDIIGIGIVCRGAESTSTRAELIALVSAAFDISTNRIHISSRS